MENQIECPYCDSTEVYSYDNESLAHGQDVKLDTEIYIFAKCNTCFKEFRMEGDITYKQPKKIKDGTDTPNGA